LRIYIRNFSYYSIYYFFCQELFPQAWGKLPVGTVQLVKVHLLRPGLGTGKVLAFGPVSRHDRRPGNLDFRTLGPHTALKAAISEETHEHDLTHPRPGRYRPR